MILLLSIVMLFTPSTRNTRNVTRVSRFVQFCVSRRPHVSPKHSLLCTFPPKTSHSTLAKHVASRSPTTLSHSLACDRPFGSRAPLSCAALRGRVAHRAALSAAAVRRPAHQQSTSDYVFERSRAISHPRHQTIFAASRLLMCISNNIPIKPNQ